MGTNRAAVYDRAEPVSAPAARPDAADNYLPPKAITSRNTSHPMKADKSDIRDQAAYGSAEAARYLRLPAATLRTWLVGRDYPKGDAQATFHPLIKPANAQLLQLSFYNLIEAHVLRALRTEHGVALAELRKAIAYAEKKLQLHRLLLSQELRTHAGQVFLDRYVELINLSASGQLAMRKMFENHLQRVEWDEWQFPVRLYPYTDSMQRGSERPIAIDPLVAFGRPIVQRAGISTAAIADRIDAGETVDALAEDYDLTHDEIEQAVLYSRAA
jgi:uncharacterized protein (DUF433 family)/DNA-binding transcriptional regulator YiaG